MGKKKVLPEMRTENQALMVSSAYTAEAYNVKARGDPCFVQISFV